MALFHKAQIIIWQLFLQKPKSILATILQRPKYYFCKNNYFMLKAQMLFWHILTKSLTRGKYNYSSLKKYLSYKIYKSPCVSPMVKTMHFVGTTKPKEV